MFKNVLQTPNGGRLMEAFSDNPYDELSVSEREDQLVELNMEWNDICRRRTELELEGTVNQEHRKMVLESLGVLVLPSFMEQANG